MRIGLGKANDHAGRIGGRQAAVERAVLYRAGKVASAPEMIEVFRNADSALVGLYQSILEDAKIQTYVRNDSTQQALVADLATAIFPLPIFFPTLCVVNDEDYPTALEIIRGLKAESSSPGESWACAQCGEAVPANFDTCWNCQSSRPKKPGTG